VEPGHPIEAAVPKQLWVDPQRCAREGVDGLEANRRIVVPGRTLRAGFAALQYVPSAVKLPLTERVLRG
jgi:short-subunit dehydrogenase